MVINEKCSQTDLVNPQLAHDDVMHCGGDLSPYIVVPAGVELQVNGTWGWKETNSDERKAAGLADLQYRSERDLFLLVSVLKTCTTCRSLC